MTKLKIGDVVRFISLNKIKKSTDGTYYGMREKFFLELYTTKPFKIKELSNSGALVLDGFFLPQKWFEKEPLQMELFDDKF